MADKIKEAGRKINKKWIIGILIAVLVIGCGTAYYMMPDTVEVTVAGNGNVAPTLIGTGRLAGDTTTIVYADVAGKVTEKRAKVGDKVNAGDVLLTYEGTNAQDALAIASADAAAAKSVFADAKANKAKYEALLADATARDAQYEANYNAIKAALIGIDTNNRIYTNTVNSGVHSDILELQKRLAGYQAELAYVEADLKKAELLQTTGGVNDLSLRAISLQGKVYDTNAEIVEHQKILAQFPTDGMSPEAYNTYLVYQEQLEATMRNWTQAKNDKSTAESMVAAYRDVFSDEAVAKKADIAVKQAQQEVAKTNAGCVAPCTGIITESFVDTGAQVEKGTQVFEIQADNSYKVNMQVSRFDIDSVKVGQSAKVTVGENTYDGTVTRISSAASNDASGKPKANVEVMLATTDPQIVGLEADVVVDLGALNDTLCAPTDCVFKDDAGSYIYLMKDGKVERQSVKTGMADSTNTQILEGLSNGDHIVSDLNADKYVGEEVEEKIVTVEEDNENK